MPDAEPFDAFMRRALFDPQHGYYSRNISTVGSRGDFSTSPTASQLLGKAIARWLLAGSKTQTTVRTIIEVGGGDGSLMQGVRKQIGWLKRRRFRFSMVETSAPLRAQQQKRLGDHVRWFESLSAALNACNGVAFIFHNELLDAFPVRLIEWNAAAQSWNEVWLQTQADNCVFEELRQLGPAAVTHSVLQEWSAASPPPHTRQRCELHVGLRAWLDEWTPHWKSGAMLTLDYGDLFPALYHRRPHGTLRAYLLHQRVEGPAIYQNIGRQDITADINFTDLRHWLAATGCTEIGYETQREFIHRQLGTHASPRCPADQFILDPEGAGSAFKCLGVRLPPR